MAERDNSAPINQELSTLAEQDDLLGELSNTNYNNDYSSRMNYLEAHLESELELRSGVYLDSDEAVSIYGNNTCGQAAIAAALAAHGYRADSGSIMATNPAEIFTAPDTIVEYLNPLIGAQFRNNGTLDALREQIDQGNSPVCLIDGGGSPHWVTITGYEVDENNNITQIETNDGSYTVAEFLEAWKEPMPDNSALGAVSGVMSGYENAWIQTGKNQENDTPVVSDVATENLLGSAVNNVVAGASTGGVTQVARGVTQGLLGTLAAVPSVLGQSISSGGEALIDLGKRAEDYGFWGQVGGAAATGVGHMVKAFGDAVDFVGDSISTVGDFLARLWPWSSTK